MTDKPAELLLGLDLPNGWRVVERLPRKPGDTGGNFSVCYLVERDLPRGGVEKAFLKALDLTVALRAPGSRLNAITRATTAYAHERDIVMDCARSRMSNVVVGIDAGEVQVDISRLDPVYHLIDQVPYLVFECATADVRAALTKKLVVFDDAWGFRMLHGAANGIRQMHQQEMAHQDIKPSNVMAFDTTAKVGDLGRASPRGGGGLFDGMDYAGDPAYVPPEFAYLELNPDDRSRRRAGDLFQVGSLIAFFFADVGMTAMLFSELDATFHPRTWPNDYRNVLPYVRQAFDQAVRRLEPHLPEYVRGDLMRLVMEMCDPDPLVRGNPRVMRSGPARYDLQRYVSVFDRLAVTAERRLRKGLT